MASETVTIACKHPNGVTLNLDRYEVVNPANNLIRRIGGGASVTLNGWAHKWGEPDPTHGSTGYRLTSIPKDFWEHWLDEHPEFPMLLDKTIVGPPAKGTTTDVARDHADVPKMFAPDRGELRAAQADHQAPGARI